MSDLNIKPILEWFQQAKSNPTIKDACVQVGCHYEEVYEMYNVTHKNSEESLCELAYDFKMGVGGSINDICCVIRDNKKSIEMLDALCDQIVTAIGVAYMMGFDIEKALAEVNRSNWSKFVDGKPVFTEQGKIAKPDSYSPPELKEFIK